MPPPGSRSSSAPASMKRPRNAPPQIMPMIKEESSSRLILAENGDHDDTQSSTTMEAYDMVDLHDSERYEEDEHDQRTVAEARLTDTEKRQRKGGIFKYFYCQRSRRCLGMVFMLIGILLVIIIGISAGVKRKPASSELIMNGAASPQSTVDSAPGGGNNGDPLVPAHDPSAPPNVPESPGGPPPNVSELPTSVRDVLAPLVLQRGQEFEQGNTYQARAAEILETDMIIAQYILEDDATRLLQRYGLLCLHLATNQVDTPASRAFYNGNIPTWKEGTLWSELMERSECEWPGVECDAVEYVHTLDLTGFQLTGVLPEELTLLSLVWEGLTLNDNPGLSNNGEGIPEFLSKPWLTTLSLEGTAYQGVVPDKICSSRLALTVECSLVQCPDGCCQPCTSNNDNSALPPTNQDDGVANGNNGGNGPPPVQVTLAPSSMPTSAPIAMADDTNDGMDGVMESGGLTDAKLLNLLFGPINNAPAELVSLDETLLGNPNSYRYKAFELLQQSTNLTGLVKLRIAERYALLCFYFSTHNVATSTTQLFLEGGEAGPWSTFQWTDADRLNENYCLWHGVSCNPQGRVTRLWLQNNNLTGNLPPELTLLTKLRILNFRNNPGLGGALPDFLGRLPSYVRGDLSGANYVDAPPETCLNANGQVIEGVLFLSTDSGINCPCCEFKDRRRDRRRVRLLRQLPK